MKAARPQKVEDDGEGGGVAVDEEGAADHGRPLGEVEGAEHGREAALWAGLIKALEDQDWRSTG